MFCRFAVFLPPFCCCRLLSFSVLLILPPFTALLRCFGHVLFPWSASLVLPPTLTASLDHPTPHLGILSFAALLGRFPAQHSFWPPWPLPQAVWADFLPSALPLGLYGALSGSMALARLFSGPPLAPPCDGFSWLFSRSHSPDTAVLGCFSTHFWSAFWAAFGPASCDSFSWLPHTTPWDSLFGRTPWPFPSPALFLGHLRRSLERFGPIFLPVPCPWPCMVPSLAPWPQLGYFQVRLRPCLVTASLGCFSRSHSPDAAVLGPFLAPFLTRFLVHFRADFLHRQMQITVFQKGHSLCEALASSAPTINSPVSAPSSSTVKVVPSSFKCSLYP